MDVICVALGGLGSSFDQLAMNRDMLLKHNVNLKVMPGILSCLMHELGGDFEQGE